MQCVRLCFSTILRSLSAVVRDYLLCDVLIYTKVINLIETRKYLSFLEVTCHAHNTYG